MEKPEIEALENKLRGKTPRRKAVDSGKGWLSTGLTLLDLQISGKVGCGIPVGGYLYFVGDSESGKSFLSMQILTEAAIDRRFDKHRLIHDNSEHANMMDVGRYFPPLADRLEPLGGTRKDPDPTAFVEDFYYRLYGLLKSGPAVVVEDSMDALRAKPDEAKFEVAARGKKAEENGQVQVKGSYGTAKAKANSDNIKRITDLLARTGSILVIISQTRDAINTPFPMKTHGGGLALKGFANVQVWTSVKAPFVKKKGEKSRVIGAYIKFDVRKNRVNGRHGSVVVPFHPQHGFDDVGSCVDYLVEEDVWPKAKKSGIIRASEMKYNGHREKLIAEIEKRGWEPELRKLTEAVWHSVEEAYAVRRKPRYSV